MTDNYDNKAVGLPVLVDPNAPAAGLVPEAHRVALAGVLERAGLVLDAAVFDPTPVRIVEDADDLYPLDEGEEPYVISYDGTLALHVRFTEELTQGALIRFVVVFDPEELEDPEDEEPWDDAVGESLTGHEAFDLMARRGAVWLNKQTLYAVGSVVEELDELLGELGYGELDVIREPYYTPEIIEGPLAAALLV